MSIQTGQLRHVVQVERYDISQQDSTGQPIRSWVRFVSDARAAIRPFSGRELYAASEKLAEANTKIKMRWFAGLDAGMRIVHNGPNCCGASYTLYDIMLILDTDMRHYEYNLICRSGLNEG